MKELYSGSSEYGTYRIVDTTYNNRPARLLYGSDNSPQSGVARDDNPELLFDYNQRFMEMIMSHQPHRLLVIGGGTCTLPVAALRLFPDLAIDVIEIDSLLIDLALQHFDLPESPRIRTFIDDALAHLQGSGDQYDMIIIDAFSGYDIPPHLLQESAIHTYRNHLSKNGIVAMNLISEYKTGEPSIAHEIATAFNEAFPHIAIYQSDPEYMASIEQNYLLVAGFGEIHFDYLQSREVKPV